ncbi:LysM peptidoglycan-binding domain-containing protein [Alkalithermobacter paradoxus]|uniref:Putative peptidoglycan endopeptidase LytE n=1 Tax=Alkalithermobacter paradoxus TaxID=29349 RepID=A0A1V4I8N2_9FIRM|nr:putative peptidoglycan endopeptidase LytE precursor [[Clostridium] thermoalcaliphilum]
MHMFQSYKLEKNGEDYTLVLNLDPSMTLGEFGKEFLSDENERKSLEESVKKYVSKNFNNLKVTAAKVMVGGILITSVSLGQGVIPSHGQTSSQSLNENISVTIDGKPQTYTQSPVVVNNIVYVPLRSLAQSIGASVWFNSTSNTVGINKGDTQIAFIIGSSVARKNGTQISMPGSSIINGTIMAPVTFLGEHLDFKAIWNAQTRTITITTSNNFNHVVVPGDTLWRLSQTYKVSIDSIKSANNLKSDVLMVGQNLIIPTSTNNLESSNLTYTVKSGDTLWRISQAHNVTVDAIKSANNLRSDIINIGQTLIIPTNTPKNNSVTTYVVQPGDSISSISSKFNVSSQDILRFNYMNPGEWLDAGQTIYISDFAPRDFAISPFEDTSPKRVGKLVDWFRDGQYLIKRGDTLLITDVDTGKQFKARMIGGYNHIDIEPITRADTQVMQELFPTWRWEPRAVVIFKDGMNIAASLSGMPHAHNTITDNGVTGHFDIYLLNSKPHNTTTSQVYINQHMDMVNKAAGK